MDSYKETFETWNKLARQYQDLFMDLDLYNESYDQFCTSLNKKDARILDAGCGPGNITRYLLSKSNDYIITGIDIAPNMLELAGTNNPQARFACMDIRNIRGLNEKFDGIIAGFSLPYLSASDSIRFINDCSDLLDSKGILYLSFVEGKPQDSGFLTGSTGDRTYFNYHSFHFLNDQLIKNGFSLIRSMKVNYYKSASELEIHTILLAEKTT